MTRCRIQVRTSLLTPLLCLALASPAAGQDPAVDLLDAAREGDLARMRLLLRQDVDPDQAEPDGTSALHWAVYRDDIEATRLLLQANAGVGPVNRYGSTPLSVAAQNGNAAVIDLLLEAGSDANTVLPEGETVLMTASRTGRADAVRMLLDHGADANAQETWRGQTALMWAAAEGHAEVVETLLDHGADFRMRSNGGFTALLFAAREGRIDAVRALLDAGASLDEALPANNRRRSDDAGPSEPPDGLNAFLLAAANAHYELAAQLVERGADPNAAPLGWTALHQLTWVRKAGIAGSNNPAPEGSGSMTSLEFVRTLVMAGAEVNALVTARPPAGITSLNMVGGTPFLLAARTADAPLMTLLVELGADPLRRNEDGTTPLMVAAGVGTNSPGEDPGTEPEVLEAVKLALALGGEVNAVDANGNTAMHGAAYKHAPSVVRLLAESGARPEVWSTENGDGHTPLDVAEGIQRGMNIVGSVPTAEAIREVLSVAISSGAGTNR